MMSEDVELLRRYAEEGSEEAFAELVRRRLGLVYAVAMRQTRDAHLAADATQAVFLALARKAASVARRETLAGWLYRSAQFAARDLVRAAGRRQARELKAHAMQQLSNPEPEPEWAESRPLLDEVLGNLGTLDRDAVLLRFIDGRPFAEIGARLGLAENAARMRVERALEKMRGRLAQRGVMSTAAALATALAGQGATAIPAGLGAAVTSAALAGGTAAAGGSAALGILKIMSTNKIMTLVASGVALAIVGFGVWEDRQAHQTEASLGAVSRERDELPTRLRSPEKPPLTTEKPPVESTRSSAPGRVSPQGAWQAESPVNFVLDHPEARAAFIQQEVLRAQLKFDRFFRTAGLSAAQQAALLKQISNFAEAKLDLTAAVRAQGFGPNNPPQDPQAYAELMKLDYNVDQEFLNNVRTSLGDEAYRQFWDYRKTISERNAVDQVATQLSTTGSPLTADQGNQLVEILAKNRFQAAATPSPADTLGGAFVSGEARGSAMVRSNLVNGDIMMPGIDWSATVTDAAVAGAQAILSPEQLAALRQVQALQSAQLTLLSAK